MKAKQKILIIVISILLLANNSIFATNYYVSLSGNDNNIGSESLPFRTITFGVTVLIAGDTLIVKNGDYGNEKVIISQSGTADNPIVVMAENEGQAVLNGPRLASEWDSECGNGIFLLNETIPIEYIQIQGFYIKNYETGVYGEGDDGIYQSHINITNCTFENNTGDGIVFWKANNIIIDNCTFISGIPDGIAPPITDDYVLQDYGIGLYYVNNSSLQNNYFFGTQAQAISFKYGCHNSLVKQNIFEGVVSACIFIGQRSYTPQEYCSDIIVEKNIFRCAQDYELETPIRIDVVENVEVFLNYLEGFASHSETSGILFEISTKGTVNIHDNILAFGTLSNYASGSYISYQTTTTPTINYHHNTFYSLMVDVNGATDEVTNAFTDNLSFQCEYYDETAESNFTGDPSFISGNPVKQIETTVPTIRNFEIYYNQLVDPFRLVDGSSAINFGYRFDYETNISSVFENTFTIYPNPASDYIIIDIAKNIKSIDIFDQTGEKLIQSDSHNNRISISLLPKGIFFIIVKTNKNEIFRKVFLK